MNFFWRRGEEPAHSGFNKYLQGKDIKNAGFISFPILHSWYL